jgi:HPt (histidine-containing phosphotransfer) domain-containing protein
MAGERNFGPLARVMDVENALRRLGDDVELLDQIIQIFLEDAPGLVHSAREALARGDAAELRRSAHSLKGMMATLGAQTGVNAAYRLEQCAASNELTEASTLIHECGERVGELTRALQEYGDGGAPSSAHTPSTHKPAPAS